MAGALFLCDLASVSRGQQKKKKQVWLLQLSLSLRDVILGFQPFQSYQARTKLHM